MIPNIKEWILNKLGKPVIPIMKQVIYVIDIVKAKIDDTLKALETLGISVDGTILNNIKNILSAMSVVRAALIKVLEYMGVTYTTIQDNQSLSKVNLNDELDKLKKLL